MESIKNYLVKLQKKDRKYIDKAEARLKSLRREDIEFSQKVDVLSYKTADVSNHVSMILEQLLDYPLINQILGIAFSKAKVVSVLKDKEFTAFLLQSNLFNRTVNLSFKTAGQVKLRIYFAIINFDTYKKHKVYLERGKE